MSRRSDSSNLSWELIGLRAKPRRRWPRRFLWLGTWMVCLGYALKLAWFALGGSIQVHLVYDRTLPPFSQSTEAQPADVTPDLPAKLEDQVNALEQELQLELQHVQRAIEQIVPRSAERDELELHFRTLSTRELLEWLPVWMTQHGYSIPSEVQLRLTVSRRRLAQLEQALSELGRHS